MLPISNWNGSSSKLRTLKKKQGECLQLFLEWLQVPILKIPTSIVEKVPPSDNWKLLKCHAQLLFFYSFILALVLCSMLTLYFQVNVETFFPVFFNGCDQIQTDPLWCITVISVDQQKCYSTHPFYHDDQVGLRFSFDVLKMYLESTFINLLIPIFFRAWLRVTDPSTRTYQQNI